MRDLGDLGVSGTLSRFAAYACAHSSDQGAGRIVGGRSQHEELLGRSSEPLKRVVSLSRCVPMLTSA